MVTDGELDVVWCENCTELVTVPEVGIPVHAGTETAACGDEPHRIASPVRSTPAQWGIVIRLRPDYPEYEFTIEFGAFITAHIPGALPRISEKTGEALRGRLRSDRSRRNRPAEDVRRHRKAPTATTADWLEGP